jgi:hypothetical protein
MTAWPEWILSKNWPRQISAKGAGAIIVGSFFAAIMGENLPMRGFATRVFRVMMIVVGKNVNHCERMAHLKAATARFWVHVEAMRLLES